MEKKKSSRVVSIRVDPELWHQFKIFCVTYNLKASNVINELIRKKLEEHKGGIS